MTWKKSTAILYAHAALGLAMLLYVFWLTYWYVSSERTFYYWDRATYRDIALSLFSVASQSIPAALQSVYQSFRNDYNAIFAIPLAPFLRIFGVSRMAFEQALAFIYLVPYSLALGLVATAVLSAPRRAVFWTTAFLTLLIPVSWIPILRGYPDAGAAMLMALAVWLFIRQPRSGWIQAAAIGVLLSLAILFRRHFAFDVIAFFSAMLFQRSWGWYTASRAAGRIDWRHALSAVLEIAVVGVAVLAVLFLLGRPFLERSLGTNYLALYDSFARPVPDVLAWFSGAFGVLTWSIGLLGYALGLYFRTVRSERIRFLLVYAVVAAALWLFWVRESGYHYTLHMSMLVIPGWAIAGWTIYLRAARRWRVPLLGGLLSSLIVTMVLTLAPVSLPTTGALAALLPRNYAPEVLASYQGVEQLIRYLRTETTPGAPVYVLNANTLLNNDLARIAEPTLFGDHNRKLYFLVVPTSDSRDQYPLVGLLQAKYLVLAEGHRRNHQVLDHNKVTTLVADLFTGGWGVARAFERLPARFPLGKRAEASIHARVRQNTLAEMLETLRFFQDNMPKRPGRQLAWLPLMPDPSISISNKPGGYNIVLSPTSADPAAYRLLYIDNVPATGVVRGSLTASRGECPDLTFQVSTVDAGDGVTLQQQATLARRGTQPLDLAFTAHSARALLLEITPLVPAGAAKDCAIGMTGIRVEPRPANP